MPHSPTVVIRPEQPADYPATEALARAAFAPDNRVAELIRRLRASDTLIAALNLVAEVNHVVAGHIMFSRALVSSGHIVALLSPLGVLPAYQRRGVGTRLIEHALAWLRTTTYPLVVLEGVPTYYPRFGFMPASSLGLEPPYPLPRAVWQAYRLPAYTEPVRGIVTYPAPFDFLHPNHETHP